MSETDDTAMGDVSPQQFGSATPANSTESVPGGGDGGGRSVSDYVPSVGDMIGSPGPSDLAKRLFVGDDGMTVSDVVEQYDCSESTAYIVRGVTRMVGVTEAPPIADVAIGTLMKIRGPE